jgi:general secretion pathway protein D
MVTQVIPLNYADPRSIRRLIAPLVSKRSAVMSYEESSMILITDYKSNVSRLLKIIKAVDVRETGREISIIPLENANADELAKTLKLVFPAAQKADEKITLNAVSFVPDERTNTIIAVAGKQDIERIKKLVEYLDLEKPKGDEKFYVYYLEYSDSETLAEVLQKIASGGSNALSGSDSSKKTAPVVSKDVAIAADKDTNTLIIKAGRSDYEVIEKLIKKLDINRPMVYLECLIVEMNMSNDFGLGSEWALGYEEDIKNSKGAYGGGFSGNTNAPYSKIGGLATQGTFPSGFSVGVMAETIDIGGVSFPNLGAVITA